MSKSLNPTTRTLRKLEADGWMAGEVERRIPRTLVTQDLFGVGDILAVMGGLTMLVQTTTVPNGANRIAKIKAEPRMQQWLSSEMRRIQVWAWRELKGKGWEPKITEIVLADLDVDLTQPESPVE